MPYLLNNYYFFTTKYPCLIYLQVFFHFLLGIDYIKYLQNQTAKQKEQEGELEKEVHALRIVKE